LKKITGCLIVIYFAAMMLTTSTALAESPDFNDTYYHWAASSIDRLAAGGYIGGYPDQTFRPDNPISRAEFTVILIKCLDINPTDNTVGIFTGTSASWANAYINEAVKLGIVVPGEYSGGEFMPNEPIKRSEAAAFLVRALGKQPQENALKFEDNADIEKSIYKGYIKAAVNEGLMAGYADGTFNPSGYTTRAQACVLFCLFLDKKGLTINPDTDNLEVLTVDNVEYQIGTTPISLKISEEKTVSINTLSKYADGLLINYSSKVALDNVNMELTINNVRYGISAMEISGKKLAVTPSSCRLVSITNNEHSYDATFTDLYIGNGSNHHYLSDMEIVDTNNVKIEDTVYDLDTSKIVIELGRVFYVIEEMDISSQGIKLVLDQTTPLAMENITVADIKSIESGNSILSLSQAGDIIFIVGNKKYSLYDIRVLDTGSVVVNDKEYLPAEVMMLAGGSFYDIEELRINRQGKLEIYCEFSSQKMIAVDSFYVNSADIEILVADSSYDLDSVLVVTRNTIRINGKEYDIGSTDIECYYNGKIYDIEAIDWDTATDSIIIDTVEGLGIDGSILEPDKIVFYYSGSVYQEGIQDVTIYVQGVWRGFGLIDLEDETYFKYSGNRYALTDSKIRINGSRFSVENASWNSGTGVYKIYLTKDRSGQGIIEPTRYVFYYDGAVYQEGIGNVELYLKSAWREFGLIDLFDEDNFGYNDTSYSIIGFKVKIDGRQFEIDNTTWNSGTGVYKIYLL